MKTWPVTNDRGETFAFEIPYRCFSSRSIARHLAKIPGVKITATRRLFQFGKDVHVRFEFRNKRFIVWESFGDSSRLWIGPEEEQPERDELIDFLMIAVSNDSQYWW